PRYPRFLGAGLHLKPSVSFSGSSSDQRRIRDVLLENEGVDARHHDVVMAIHDKDRLLDLLQLAIAVRFGNHAPAGDSICLRPHSRHRRRDILVSATVTTFPESPSGSLARLARREE